MKNSGYVIVEGNIGVGKSTFSALLAKALQNKGTQVVKFFTVISVIQPVFQNYADSLWRMFSIDNQKDDKTYQNTKKRTNYSRKN